MIAQLVVGLGQLHQNQIMHGDLKLGNLMLDGEGHLKIINFSKAKILVGGTKSNSRCGSEEILAPEMLRKEYYDFQADWWAVGIVAYQLMFAYHPFKTANVTRKMYEQAVLNQDLELPYKV